MRSSRNTRRCTSYLVVLLLLIAHYLVTVQFNVSPLYLRLASFAIPAPVRDGDLCGMNKIGWRGAFGFGAIIAFLSVSGMLTVIGIIDNVPIIPPTFLEWRSFEYGLSIALAFSPATSSRCWCLLHCRRPSR